MNNCSLYENLQFTWIFAVLHEHRKFFQVWLGQFYMNICRRCPRHPATVSSHHQMKRARLFSGCGKAGFLSFCQCKETLFSRIFGQFYILNICCMAQGHSYRAKHPLLGFHITARLVNITQICIWTLVEFEGNIGVVSWSIGGMSVDFCLHPLETCYKVRHQHHHYHHHHPKWPLFRQ